MSAVELDDFVFLSAGQRGRYLIVHPQDLDEEKNCPDGNETNGEDANDSLVSFIDEAILPKHKHLPRFFAQRLSRMAVKLAGVTLAATLVIASLAFLASNTTASSAAFGFAFDSAFTSVSSFLIIWRFWSSRSSASELARRETLATIAVAASMVTSAACIFARAYQSLRKHEKPSDMAFVIGISSSSALAYFLLFLAKYRVAARMGSAALMTDAVDALSGGILAVALIISSVVLKYSQTVWFLDSAIGMGIAAFSVCYGVTVLVRMIAVYKDRELAATVQFYVMDKL